MSWATYLAVAAGAMVLCLGAVFLIMHLSDKVLGSMFDQPAHPRADLKLIALQIDKLSKAAPTDAELQAARRAKENAVRTHATNAALLDTGEGAQLPRICPYRSGSHAAELWTATYTRVVSDIAAARASA